MASIQSTVPSSGGNDGSSHTDPISDMRLPNSEKKTKTSSLPLIFDILSILVIVSLSIVAFINGLPNRFTFDDHLAIEGNYDTDPKQSYYWLWFHDIWGKDLVEIDSHKSYRPILISIFRQISIRVWDMPREEQAYYFRLCSIAAHCVASVAVYFLARTIFSAATCSSEKKVNTSTDATAPQKTEPVPPTAEKTEKEKSGGKKGNKAEKEKEKDSTTTTPAPASITASTPTIEENDEEEEGLESRVISLVAAMFFSSHPVHVESVTAVVNLAEPLSCLVLILAYLVFRPAFLSLSSTTKLGMSVVRVIFWISLVVLATLIKETGILAVAFVWSFLGVVTFHAIFSSTANKTDRLSFSFLIRAFLWSLIGALLVYFYFAVRSVLVSPDRNTILNDWNVLIKHIVFYFQSIDNSHSYLNSSQLLRKAENPFAFLTGQTKVLSMLVSMSSYVNCHLHTHTFSYLTIYILVPILPLFYAITMAKRAIS